MPDKMVTAIEDAARARGLDSATLVAELATDAMKMCQVPGIVIVDGPQGRRARVEGTGLDVFEIVQAYLAAHRDRAELTTAFHWLQERQIDAALTYFRLFPEDIDPLLFRSEMEVVEFVEEAWEQHPFMKPADR